MRIIGALFFSFIFFCSIKAQSSPSLDENTSFIFIPKKINSHQLEIFIPSTNKVNSTKFLTSAGCLLENLKFQSQTDKFTAIAPFDSRDFQPLSFEELNTEIQNHYLLIDN